MASHVHLGHVFHADALVSIPDGALVVDGLAATLANAVRSDDPGLARDQTLFRLLMGIRESSIAAVYVQGRQATAG